MKRFAAALMITGAAMFAGAGIADADEHDGDNGYNEEEPTVGVDTPNPVAGASFTVVVSDCEVGTTVSFTFEGTTQTDVADDAGAATIFVAPTAAGSYSGTATCGDAVLSFAINVAAAPTTAAPGATIPATGNSGTGTTMGIAAVLLLAGIGMFGVAQVRRRQVSA